jgi:hypothetical protein
MNMRLGRPVNLEENQVYYEKVVNRVRINRENKKCSGSSSTRD